MKWILKTKLNIYILQTQYRSAFRRLI
uniref:Uncharacterized protein n=1 Tax=Anguilla anguilla TaxID=7936 RepID=A0A0E9RPD6_ANGAN